MVVVLQCMGSLSMIVKKYVSLATLKRQQGYVGRESVGRLVRLKNSRAINTRPLAPLPTQVSSDRMNGKESELAPTHLMNVVFNSGSISSSSTPQIFRDATGPACDSCFARQSICSVVSFDSGMPPTVHPLDLSKVDVEH